MARVRVKNQQTGVRINTAEARADLPMSANNEPYWVAITPGTALGYYKGARDTCWFVRQRVGSKYVKQRIGTADDHVRADGAVVLSHRQAVALAVSTQLSKRNPQPRHYGDGLTLNALFDAYLEARQTTPGGRTNRVMAKTTATVTRLAWGLYVRDSHGEKLVTAVTAGTLKTWHAKIVTLPPTNRGRALPYDPTDPEQVRARRSTANRILTIAKAALSWGREHERLPPTLPDYWTRVRPFRLGDDPPPRMLEADEVTRLLNAAAPDLRELLIGALATGARQGELLPLRVADYAAEQGMVRLYQFKTGKTLWQPLTPEGRTFFDRITAGKLSSALIFTRTDGRPWARSDLQRPTRVAVAAAKLDDVSFKVTRATYGKLLLLATHDLELVAKALGHSDSRITRKHYAALLPSEVAAGIAKLPKLGFAPDTKVSRIRGRKRQAG